MCAIAAAGGCTHLEPPCAAEDGSAVVISWSVRAMRNAECSVAYPGYSVGMRMHTFGSSLTPSDCARANRDQKNPLRVIVINIHSIKTDRPDRACEVTSFYKYIDTINHDRLYADVCVCVCTFELETDLEHKSSGVGVGTHTTNPNKHVTSIAQHSFRLDFVLVRSAVDTLYTHTHSRAIEPHSVCIIEC